MNYKGTFLEEVRSEHVGRDFRFVTKHMVGWGKVFSCDMGKRIYLYRGFIEIESNEQLEQRLQEVK
jgi:hypothetical protein